MRFRFGEFELDEEAYELRRHGRPTRLARQPMELLRVLLARRGQLVSREEIAKQLWGPDVFVDLDAGIHTAVLRIRQVLGDSRTAPTFIETVSGKGYRFIAHVEAESEVSPEPSLHRRSGNLPADLTTFIGREQELSALPRLLTAGRLLTLTGAGGVGKTRLAIQLGRAVRHQFPHGVWLVDLAPLVSADLVAQTIAAVLGMRASENRSARNVLLESLRDRKALLLLDTCEHLIDTCAELAETMLRSAPELQIVATSREPLAVPGEVVYRVPSLSLPDHPSPLSAAACGDAVRLFVERATTIDPTFIGNGGNIPAIARVCRRLDGIPLAIELAAARVVVLSLGQIEERLRDRFRLLTGSTRTAVPRQRTLEATVEWSYQLLSDAERLVLNRLSVFPGSWTLEAAERVCADGDLPTSAILELLSRLVDKSLVALEAGLDSARRYRLLETVRHYAGERLLQSGDVDGVRDRHFQFVFDEFRGAQPVLRGRGQLSLLRRLRIEQENVRVALQWGLESTDRAGDGAELAGALFWFWTKRGLFEEGEFWLARAAAIPAPPRLRARALIGLAHMQDFQGRHAEAAASAEQALQLGRVANDSWTISVALFLQSLAAFEMDAHDRARECAQAARDVAISGCEIVEQGGPLLILANVALVEGDYDRAQRLVDDSVDVHRQGGDAWGLGILLVTAAGLRIIRRDFNQAGVQAAEALGLSEELEDPRGVAWSFEVFAGLLAAKGRAEAAARIWGASDGLLESAGGSVLPTIRWIRDRYIDSVRTSLGDEQFIATRAEGRMMPPAQAIAFAQREVAPFN